MNKKRILIITQEMKPYLVLSEMARITNQSPLFFLTSLGAMTAILALFGAQRGFFIPLPLWKSGTSQPVAGI